MYNKSTYNYILLKTNLFQFMTLTFEVVMQDKVNLNFTKLDVNNKTSNRILDL
jgi:hypothetical protein